MRFRFDDIRLAKWLVPALRCMALPVADKRNRFFVPLWVFIFGIASPIQVPGSHTATGKTLNNTTGEYESPSL